MNILFKLLITVMYTRDSCCFLIFDICVQQQQTKIRFSWTP